MQGITLVAERSNISIIPKPHSIKPSNGFFEFNEDTKLYLSNDLAELKTVSNFFSELLQNRRVLNFTKQIRNLQIIMLDLLLIINLRQITMNFQ